MAHNIWSSKFDGDEKNRDEYLLTDVHKDDKKRKLMLSVFFFVDMWNHLNVEIIYSCVRMCTVTCE